MKYTFKKKYIYFFSLIIFFIFGGYYYYLTIDTNKNIEVKINNELLEKKIDEIKLLNNKIKKQKLFLKSIDLKTDSEITKFVSAKVSFVDKGYVPNNLDDISTKYIIDGKGGGQRLRKIAKQALDEMGKAYYGDTGKKIVVVSAYRSYLYQKAIKDRGCPDNLCAKAGFSEHQTGLTIDLWSASSNNFWKKEPYKTRYEWLKKNAYKYGFHNTYQKGLEVDTYEIEPWHWRYLGKDLSKYLWENNLTISEFYKEMEQH